MKARGKREARRPWSSKKPRDQGLKGRNTYRQLRPFRAGCVICLIPGATRFALAPGFHIPRRWRSHSSICTRAKTSSERVLAATRVTAAAADLCFTNAVCILTVGAAILSVSQRHALAGSVLARFSFVGVVHLFAPFYLPTVSVLGGLKSVPCRTIRKTLIGTPQPNISPRRLISSKCRRRRKARSSRLSRR